MRWGLVPAYAKDPHDFDRMSTFNARVEGAEASSLWRRLLDGQRCVVLFDGFYEWKASTGKTAGKVPLFIRNRDGYDGHVIPSGTDACGANEAVETDGKESAIGPSHAPLMLAGLFDVWRGGKASAPSAGGGGAEAVARDPLETATIFTMAPDGTALESVHDRMPVFLTPETAALWLDPSKRFGDVLGPVLKNSSEHARSELLLYEVGPLVGSVRNDSPDCVLPRKEYEQRQLAKGLGRFFQKTTSPADKPAASPAENTAASTVAKPPTAGKRAACEATAVASEEGARKAARVENATAPLVIDLD